jgi:hypothetical protein
MPYASDAGSLVAKPHCWIRLTSEHPEPKHYDMQAAIWHSFRLRLLERC